MKDDQPTCPPLAVTLNTDGNEADVGWAIEQAGFENSNVGMYKVRLPTVRYLLLLEHWDWLIRLPVSEGLAGLCLVGCASF